MIITNRLPKLPYDKEALTPIITEESFDYHYGKHRKAYVKNLNELIRNTQLADSSIEEIIKSGFQDNNVTLFNNAAQHWNHSFFWNCLSPNGGKDPNGKIRKLIIRDFESFENFKEEFSVKATKIFGSGWTWLAQNQEGTLEILPMKDAQTPLIEYKTLTLTLDL